MPSRILEGLENSFKNITSGIENIFNGLSDIKAYLNSFFENFANSLKSLFIPSEDRINSLVDSVKSKFSFIDDIKKSVTGIEDVLSGAEEAPSFTLHVKSTQFTEEQDLKILDLSWYAPFKVYGDKILTAFIYAMFFWRIYIKLPSIISGASGGVNEVDKFLNSEVFKK